MSNKEGGQTISHLASIELGLKCFRLMIAQVCKAGHLLRITKATTFCEQVDLGRGLCIDKVINEEACQRGLRAVANFSLCLQSMDLNEVDVIASNSLSSAKNFNNFIANAQEVLDFPIDIIPGVKQASLLYADIVDGDGYTETNMLVIAIGGGSSTELILGDRSSPRVMESMYIGAGSITSQFFPLGYIDKFAFVDAQAHATGELISIFDRCKGGDWGVVIGALDVIRSIHFIIKNNNLSSIDSGFLHTARNLSSGKIMRNELYALKHELLMYKHVDQISLLGVTSYERAVLPGGIAILISFFDLLEISEIHVSHVSLASGVLNERIKQLQGVQKN